MKKSNLVKRFFPLLLVLILLGSALVGCKGDAPNGGEGNESESESNGSGSATELSQPVVLADGLGTYFKVIYPDTDNRTVSNCSVDLMLIADGFRLTMEEAREDGNGNTDGEILLGNTCRPQSQAAMDAIGYDDFSITYTEGKIVIAAHNAERLEEAVRYLKENLLRVTDGRLEYIGNYTFTSEEELMIGEGESFEGYKIICGDDNLYQAAHTIQQYIKNKYGVELKITFDNMAKDSKEIVLGNADRASVAFAKSMNLNEGTVAVVGDDLVIATRDSKDTRLLFDIFAEEFLSNAFTDHFNFRADYSKTVNIYEGVYKESAEREENTDIRVMSFNVLCDLWGNSAASKRSEGVMQVIKCFFPDVVGLQEVSDGWHKEINAAIKNTPYEIICTEHDHVDKTYGNTNFTPILYNADTLTLKESDTVEFTETGLRYMKTMAYAHFEHKESGKTFVALNVHYEAPGSTAEAKAENLAYRNAQTADMVALIAELEEKYNCPVVITGDFNTVEGNDKTGAHAPYWDLVEQADLKDAKKTAKKIIRACITWHELGETVSPSPAGSFDHIFGTGGVEFLYFNTLVDKILMNVSDHCPIYADIQLK